MDILKFVERYFIFTLIFFIFSCNSNSRKTIKSEIWIYNWDNKPLPKNILFVELDNEKATKYKIDYVNTGYDTLNRNKYLVIKIKSSENRISTSNVYELRINDSIYYKIYDFKTRPKNQGGDIDVKVNSGYSEIGDDDIIKISSGFKIKNQ
ncbi:hypothetical protein [Frigoriflavimonas asaccharolytica]|uniref:Lipoprotein n=1 Tax=Frigoriflavimonas asaccharolytica TaxID=2735899 RepID=A0A8J8G9U9_9FLAO|nr:hypothetical protein [Frigoriflavimonas asaccharolytica]NRS94108.1 hypothetical protein [Frigoriflavimonas asaccharolytica]